MNIWAGVGIGVLAVSAYAYSKLRKASTDITMDVKGRIHSINLTQIVIAVDAVIKNATNNALTIQYPFIKIMYQGNLIASSDLKNQTLNLEAFNQTPINGIKIPINYLRLTGVGADFIKKLMDKKTKLSFQVVVSTSLIKNGIRINVPAFVNEITI